MTGLLLRWAGAVVAAGLATAAQAQVARPRVPVVVAVPIIGCSPSTVINLEGTDGFLAVRAGPSVRERELARLHQGDAVFACLRRGNWFGIVFAPRGTRVNCHAHRSWRRVMPYSGPCRTGWVHYNHLGGYSDLISP